MNFIVVCETSDKKTYPIRPRQIRAGQPGSLLNTFGKAEIEEAAERLILFFQQFDSWVSFTLEELNAFYKKNSWNCSDPFMGLLSEWFDDSLLVGGYKQPVETFIVVCPNDTYCVTDIFIKRCANAEDPTNFLHMLGKIEKIIIDKLKTKKPMLPN